MVEQGGETIAVEAKSGRTIGSDFFSALARYGELVSTSGAPAPRPVVVYGGDESYARTAGQVLSWRDIEALAPPLRHS